MENKKKPRRVALFVGVDKYEDQSIPTLAGAVADAKSLHGFFASRPSQFDVAEMLENPTSSDVFSKVKELSFDLGEGDLFLFYFAGHGMDDDGKQKLLCTNTCHGPGSLVNDFDLRNVAVNQKWNVAVILDACRTRLDATRGIGNRVGERRDLDFYDALVQSRKEGDASLTVLFSCDEGKTAGEVKGRNHGLFTLALLDVLERADKNGRGWCFDQNLGDEIGKAMRRIADKDSGQRPWIKASGTPPLFFLPSVDVQPLIDWTVAFQKAGWISVEESAECQKAFTSPNSGAKGIFEAIRFFSQWGKMRETEDMPGETASAIIKSLCAAAIPCYQPVANAQAVSTTAMKDEAAAAASRPLGADEAKHLRETAQNVATSWCEEEPSKSAVERMRSARTVRDAMEAIDELKAAVRRRFENQHADGVMLGRIDSLFTYKAGRVVAELRSRACRSEVDSALLSLFSAAKVYTAIMAY